MNPTPLRTRQELQDARIRELEGKLQDALAECAEARKANADMRHNLDQLQGELASTMNRLADAERKVSNLEYENRQLEMRDWR